REGLTVEKAKQRLTGGQTELMALDDMVAISLQDLRQRELQCAVGITDLIQEHWRSRRCFFTFNHPFSCLLLAIADRLLTLVGRRPALSLTSNHVAEPLSQFVPPAWPAITQALRLEFPTSTSSRGVRVDLSGGLLRAKPGAAYYPPYELIETFFQC